MCCFGLKRGCVKSAQYYSVQLACSPANSLMAFSPYNVMHLNCIGFDWSYLAAEVLCLQKYFIYPKCLTSQAEKESLETHHLPFSEGPIMWEKNYFGILGHGVESCTYHSTESEIEGLLRDAKPFCSCCSSMRNSLCSQAEISYMKTWPPQSFKFFCFYFVNQANSSPLYDMCLFFSW